MNELQVHLIFTDIHYSNPNNVIKVPVQECLASIYAYQHFKIIHVLTILNIATKFRTCIWKLLDSNVDLVNVVMNGQMQYITYSQLTLSSPQLSKNWFVKLFHPILETIFWMRYKAIRFLWWNAFTLPCNLSTIWQTFCDICTCS